MGHSFRISEFVIMMSSKFLVLALLAASTQAFKLKAIVRNTPEVTECKAGTSDWFSGISLNVSPYPVEVAAGKKITIDGEFTLNKEVVAGSKLKLKLKGKVPIVGEIPIPCLPINENLNLGSCEYELEKILYDLEASENVKNSCQQDNLALYLWVQESMLEETFPLKLNCQKSQKFLSQFCPL